MASIIRNMSKHKTIDVERLAETCRVLSNPHRLRIFMRLVDCHGTRPVSREAKDADELVGACAGELGKDLGIAPSTVSHHLKELRVAGLIRMERRGKRIDCGVDREVLRELSELFTNRLFSIAAES
jgi:ArsR family transcriptional regulator